MLNHAATDPADPSLAPVPDTTPAAAAGSDLAKKSTRFALLLCTVGLAALVFRSPGIFLAPRMYGEEGMLYYASLQLPGTSMWTFVARGNYQFLVNLAAGIGQLLPAARVAYVTTAIGLLAFLAAMGLLGRLAAERGWRPWTACLAAAAIAWLPQGYEVYLNATNVQWVASLSVLLLVLLKVEEWTPAAQRWALGWLAVCAFSGVPAVTLAPLMVARAALTRSRPHIVMSGLLCLGAALQLTLALTSTHSGRYFELNPFLTVMGFFAQVIVGPLVGVRWVEPYIEIMFLSELPKLLVVLLAAGVVVAHVVLKGAAASQGGRQLAAFLCAAAVLSVLVNVLGGLGVQVTSWISGRYFLLAAVCWITLVCAAANSARPALRWAGTAVLALLVLVGGSEVLWGGWKDFMITGVPWQTMVEGCEGSRPCVVQTWPMDMGWQFRLFRP